MILSQVPTLGICGRQYPGHNTPDPLQANSAHPLSHSRGRLPGPLSSRSPCPNHLLQATFYGSFPPSRTLATVLSHLITSIRQESIWSPRPPHTRAEFCATHTPPSTLCWAHWSFKPKATTVRLSQSNLVSPISSLTNLSGVFGIYILSPTVLILPLSFETFANPSQGQAIGKIYTSPCVKLGAKCLTCVLVKSSYHLYDPGHWHVYCHPCFIKHHWVWGRVCHLCKAAQVLKSQARILTQACLSHTIFHPEWHFFPRYVRLSNEAVGPLTIAKGFCLQINQPLASAWCRMVVLWFKGKAGKGYRAEPRISGSSVRTFILPCGTLGYNVGHAWP